MISAVYGAQALIYGVLCDAGNAVRDNGFHDGAGMWRRIYDGVDGRYPDNGIVDLDDAIAICFTENVILLLRIYMVMNESKIIERRMQVGGVEYVYSSNLSDKRFLFRTYTGL